MKVINIMNRIQVLLIGVTLLLINNICLADDINNSMVRYYRWAMIERQDRKPIFSATTTLKHIYSPNSKHEKNFYKSIYKNDIIKEVSTYNKDKLVRIDYFNKDGLWVKYSKYDDNNEIKCTISFNTLKRNEQIYTISCEDNSMKITTYKHKKWTDYQKKYLKEKKNSGYWAMYKVVKYKNLKRIFKQVIVDSICFEYDNDDKLIAKGQCSDYEHTKPMDNAVWSMVPMW